MRPASSRPLMLVEDNPADLDLTLRAFARRKLVNPVLVARDGQEALDWIPRWAMGEPLPLVVLLDIKLPRVSGLEVLQRLREERLTRLLPVVMLTSSSQDADIHAAYEGRANSYIIKPVTFERLIDVAAQIERYWCDTNHPPA